MSLDFGQPWALLLILLLPAYVLLARRWRPRLLVFSRAGVLGRIAPAAGRRLGQVPGWMRALAFVALVLALAVPRTGATVVHDEAEGIAIMLVIDLSSSMLAEDFHPRNRLEVARQTAAEFIQGRAGDRIGLVAFAGVALTQVPLTTDYPVLYRALEQMEIGLLEDGTAIGTAIATAANRLRHAPGESRVMILLTDGVNNRGEIDPMTAARAATAFDIRIYSIGVGSEGTAPMPVARDVFGRYRYADVPVEIDEELLGEISRMSGARYFRATDERALADIYRRIDEMERTTVDVRRYVEYTPQHLPFLLLAGLFLAGEWLLRGSRWGRVP